MSLLVEKYAMGLVEQAVEQAKDEQQKSIAEKVIKTGKMALQEIADCTGLSLSTVSQLAKKLEQQH